jgi:hypothetical protein
VVVRVALSLWRTQRCTGVWTPSTSRSALPERLGAVDHAEHALLDIQAALDEAGPQRRGDRAVLG